METDYRAEEQEPYGMNDARLVGEIMVTVEPVIAQSLRRTIGRRRNGTRSVCARNDFGREVVDRHDGNPVTSLKRRRHDVKPSPHKNKSCSEPGSPIACPGEGRGSGLVLRKPRDFDSELKALTNKARLLKGRKVQQLGELVIATGADSLDPDTLTGALLGIVKTKDAKEREAWRNRGAAFFRGQSRKTDRGTQADIAGDQANQSNDAPR
jgi:DNA-binding protein H-NS